MSDDDRGVYNAWVHNATMEVPRASDYRLFGGPRERQRRDNNVGIQQNAADGGVARGLVGEQVLVVSMIDRRAIPPPGPPLPVQGETGNIHQNIIVPAVPENQVPVIIREDHNEVLRDPADERM
ncbi:hypothetical protein QAD02_012616 [Eretmocerus hayati]|uniref:Uncharacterized protein n=1 Tax=Eretmocerus hayati TaxID=131215 RepID=A0ACC2P0G6_9HYME|nr:hypothetical protein QAD02_012616 [Eretmocerus hayati]